MSHQLDLPDDLVERAEHLLSLHPKREWHPDALNALDLCQQKGHSIAVACSGGADSLFMLLLLHAAFLKFRKNLTVLHFNHSLRGEESNRDESFVSSLCSKLGLRFVSELAENIEKKDEGTLRELRMRFFRKVSAKKGFKFIVQGHHLNDVAETLLWRIPRGISTDGLTHPQPLSEVGSLSFVRPLVNLPKASIVKLMEIAGVPWREDGSNLGNDYVRNRMRHSVLPAWQEACDRELLQGIYKTTQSIREDSVALAFHAKQTLAECIEPNDYLNCTKLQPYPPATKMRVIRLWLGKHLNGTDKSHAEKAQIVLKKLIEANSPSLQIGKETWVRKTENCLFLEMATKVNAIPLSSLPLMGTIYLNGNHCSQARLLLYSEKIREKISQKQVTVEHEAFISAHAAKKGIFIRSRKEKDSFQPLGSHGSKKLSERMIDQKWNQSQKTETPVFINSTGEILWVPGFPPSEFAKVTSVDEGVMHLTYHSVHTEC